MANHEVIANNVTDFQNIKDMTIENSPKCTWNKYSESKLLQIERKILNVVKTKYRGWFVNVDYPPDNESKIWTISMNTEAKNTPLVLLHGFGAGVGFWCLNLDSLSEKRPLYAIDILGFGRSSRPEFNADGKKAEQEIVESIEKWREKVNLEKIILLGHSMGAYLATSYTIKYPDRVKHLILADPWGFVEKPANFNPPLWAKALGFLLYPFTWVNPLATVRALGPAGPWIIKKMRSDIANKYSDHFDDPNIISEYIYQCNAQKPTGETAFHRLIKGFGWAKYPMLERANELRPNIPITVLHGSHSWMDKTVGDKLKDLKQDSRIHVKTIINAGHHIHADNPESFNEIVCEVCNNCDANKPKRKAFSIIRDKQQDDKEL